MESVDYLGDSQKSSWLAKLEVELQQRQWLEPHQRLSADDYEVWAVSMPSYLGFHGINPLTVYYIYRKRNDKRDGLWLCLLEVHNTFSERHLYVLPAGKGEDAEREEEGKAANANERAGDGISCRVEHRRRDYEHQWTFPRSFHVSPFNDRGGYYRLYLKDLWRPGSSEEALPTLDVRLLLLEPGAPPAAPEGADEQEVDALLASRPATPLVLRKKILATLSSYPHDSEKAPQPLTAGHLISRLARQPLDLVLTFVRIAWQAAKLHYGRPRLDVYNKPEPSIAVGEKQRRLKATFDGIGWPPSTNATQLEREGRQSPTSGALLRTLPTSTDEMAKERFLAVVARSNVPVTLVNPNGSVEEIPAKATHSQAPALTVYLMSPAFFSDVLFYRTPRLALLMGSRVGRRWGVSDVALFEQLFESAAEAPDLARTTSPTRQLRLIQWVRKRHENWAQRLAREPAPIDDEDERSSMNLLDVVLPPTLGLAWSVWTLHMVLVLQEAIFRWVRARYVPGTEPWLEWKEGMRLMREDEDQQQVEM